MIPLDELENSGATRDGPSDADAKRFDFLASPCFNPYRGRTAHAHAARDSMPRSLEGKVLAARYDIRRGGDEAPSAPSLVGDHADMTTPSRHGGIQEATIGALVAARRGGEHVSRRSRPRSGDLFHRWPTTVGAPLACIRRGRVWELGRRRTRVALANLAKSPPDAAYMAFNVRNRIIVMTISYWTGQGHEWHSPRSPDQCFREWFT